MGGIPRSSFPSSITVNVLKCRKEKGEHCAYLDVILCKIVNFLSFLFSVSVA